VTVTVVDPDQSTSASQANTIPTSRLRLIETPLTGVPTGNDDTAGISGMTALTETAANSGRFTATWSLSGLEDNKRYHVVYLDPRDTTGQTGRVVASFVTTPSNDDLVPRFDRAVYTSGQDVITVTVPGYTHNVDTREIQVWYRSLAGTGSWSSQTLTLSSQGSVAFSPTEAPGVTRVQVPFISEIFAVYRSVERFLRRKVDEQEVNVLVEVGFISNRDEERMLTDPRQQDALAVLALDHPRSSRRRL
jgi:hypothetical protein